MPSTCRYRSQVCTLSETPDWIHISAAEAGAREGLPRPGPNF
jgi:hypothetical protein